MQGGKDEGGGGESRMSRLVAAIIRVTPNIVIQMKHQHD